MGCQFGFTGAFRRGIRASAGVRSAFRKLQGRQANTQFSHVLVPPRDRGWT